jgi:hypothetical protein
LLLKLRVAGEPFVKIINWIPSFAMLGAMALPLPVVAQTPSPAPSPPCDTTRIASMMMPVGPARVDHGQMTLDNGATLELSGPPKGAEMNRVSSMHIADMVIACYGPVMRYADAPPSRTITILDLRNGSYYGTPIGTWSF